MSGLSGVILAGGRSQRMGQDKALLKLGDQRLIDRVAETMSRVADELIVVASGGERYAGTRWRVVPDEYPNAGSLGGLYSGLRAAQHSYAVVVACDMPFLDAAVLKYLASLAPGWDAVVPRAAEGRRGARGDAERDRPTAKSQDLQPLHAVYHRRVADAIADQIEASDLRVIGFLPHIRARYVEPEELDALDPERLSFFNANTPEEWAWARERLNV